MSRVLVNGYWDHGKKKEIRSYAIYGGLIPPYTMKLNGERYIMPGWYKLSKNEDTPNIEDIRYIPYKPNKDNIPNIDSNIDDIAFYPYKPSIRPLPEESIGKVYKVLSSKGDKEYEVNTNASGSLECSCVGYGYRRKCRHIDQITNSL